MKTLIALTLAAVAALGQTAIIESRSDWAIASGGSQPKTVTPTIKDARNLKIGDMIVVELSTQDRAAFSELEGVIAKAQQAIEAKRQEILARHNAQDYDPRNGIHGFSNAVCGPSTRFEVEWRAGHLLITRITGFDPCGGMTLRLTPHPSTITTNKGSK